MRGQEELRAIVQRHFRVYDAREEKVRGEVVAQLYYLMFPPTEFDARYEAVRRDIRALDAQLIVFVRREGGEDILFVADRPMVPPQRLRLHVVLLLLTVLTTTTAGALHWQSYNHPTQPIGWREAFDPVNLLWGGLAFALPLMLILGLHEAAHYVVARKHGLRATLPFFIPVPATLMPIGTLGAFISLRDPLPDRKALFDVGAAGPIAGFLVAIPVVIAGAWLTASVGAEVPDLHRPDLGSDAPHTLSPLPGEADTMGEFGHATLDFASPPAGHIVWKLTAPDDAPGKWSYKVTARVEAQDGSLLRDTHSGKLAPGQGRLATLAVPANATSASIEVTWEDGVGSFGEPLLTKAIHRFFGDGNFLTHPTAFAGWVGLLVTGINLLPASQLDGGHVARAVLGDRMRYVAYAAVAGLIGLALLFQQWLLMALFILFMGIQHPPPLNDRTPLDRKRKALAALVLLIFALTFVARPILA